MRLAVPLLALLVLLAAGCGGGGGGNTVAACTHGKAVDLALMRGHARSTLALAPVTIDGKGPFAFALDTGAAKSAIDVRLARKLGLEVVSRGKQVEGIAGVQRANVVAVHDWKVGDVAVHGTRIASLPLFGANPDGPVGLLGSDVLSRFSSVCIDYQEKSLRLGLG